ncbi:MAG: pyridoxamine 5'-phosphate oxidase family protein [Deltaproteobacteria bacterium]|nr:pyridoxamine 5'-phosphate oxidase family protein [Deltaproteobacteria bacterium]
MTTDDFYGQAARQLQDRFDTRRLADRLRQVRVHETLTSRDRALIERAPMVLLATADADGRPDCSYKGGVPGFVRIVDEATLELPSYDGNGMFRSLGNVIENPHVGLLFIDFSSGARLRCNGRAQVLSEAAVLGRHHGAQLVVRVAIEQLFPNCGRYLHRGPAGPLSEDAPRPGHQPPPAAWKQKPDYDGTLPSQ